jgi:hypothetical protein
VTQTINVPTDSIKLRQLQVAVTPMIAQISGQAIVGAIDSAIDAGFNGSPQAVTPNGSGFTYQIPLGAPAADIIGGAGSGTSGRSGTRTGSPVIRRQGGNGAADAGASPPGGRAAMARRLARGSLTCRSFRWRPVRACHRLAKRGFRRTK